MLFTAGALAGIGSMNIFTLIIVVYLAAVLGDTANYHIGKTIGKKILEKDKSSISCKKIKSSGILT